MAANRSTKRHNAAAASTVANASRASDHGRVAMQSHPNSDSTLGIEFGAARLCKPHGSLRQPTHTRTHARGDELDVLLRPSLSETQTKHKVHASFKTTCICRGNMLTDAFDISSLHLYYHGSPTTAPNKIKAARRKTERHMELEAASHIIEDTHAATLTTHGSQSRQHMLRCSAKLASSKR